MLQVYVLSFMLILFAKFNLKVLGLEPESFLQALLYIIECILIDGIVGSFIMGVYLYICNRFLNIHLDEASTSLGEEDFKNFLRMHVGPHGIKVYPIGIRTVMKKWKAEGSGEKIHFTTQEEIKIPVHHLIEDPITINL